MIDPPIFGSMLCATYVVVSYNTLMRTRPPFNQLSVSRKPIYEREQFLVRALAIDRPRRGPVFAKERLQIDEVREGFVRDGREWQNMGMAD